MSIVEKSSCFKIVTLTNDYKSDYSISYTFN